MNQNLTDNDRFFKFQILREWRRCGCGRFESSGLHQRRGLRRLLPAALATTANAGFSGVRVVLEQMIGHGSRRTRPFRRRRRLSRRHGMTMMMMFREKNDERK